MKFIRDVFLAFLFYGALWLGVVMLVLLTLALLGARKAQAHDYWTNGVEVPSWVKSACCGPEDVHLLPESSVHIRPDGYHIDGIETIVPMNRALPSPDGKIWGFWSPLVGTNPTIYCFFYPINGV